MGEEQQHRLVLGQALKAGAAMGDAGQYPRTCPPPCLPCCLSTPRAALEACAPTPCAPTFSNSCSV